jgi:hypothetical protein
MPLGVRKDANTLQPAATNSHRAPLSLDAYGGLRVNAENQYPIFSVGLNVDPAASPTDVFTITTASPITKVIGLRKIILSGTIATTANDQVVKLIRRITLDTGGTATVPTGVPHDSALTATAVMALYTANPAALGTVFAAGAATPDGSFDLRRMALSVAAGTAIPAQVTFDYTAAPILLRAATEQIAVNLVTANNLVNLDIYCEWDERPTTS